MITHPMKRLQLTNITLQPSYNNIQDHIRSVTVTVNTCKSMFKSIFYINFKVMYIYIKILIPSSFTASLLKLLISIPMNLFYIRSIVC